MGHGGETRDNQHEVSIRRWRIDMMWISSDSGEPWSLGVTGVGLGSGRRPSRGKAVAAAGEGWIRRALRRRSGPATAVDID